MQPPGAKKVHLMELYGFKMILVNNVVMVGLTILMHLQQVEHLKFQFFSGGT